MIQLPADKAQHYVWGSAAAALGACMGLLLAHVLARGSPPILALLAPRPGLLLLVAGTAAVLCAWLAGCWKEARDARANARAREAHVAAHLAAVEAWVAADLPATEAPAQPFAAPHEVSAADIRYTAAGALPVLVTLLAVALAGLSA